MKKISNLSITISAGGEASDVEAVSRSYNEAEMALLYRLMMDGERVLAYREVTGSRETRLNASALDWGILDKSIETGNAEGVSGASMRKTGVGMGGELSAHICFSI